MDIWQIQPYTTRGSIQGDKIQQNMNLTPVSGQSVTQWLDVKSDYYQSYLDIRESDTDVMSVQQVVDAQELLSLN